MFATVIVVTMTIILSPLFPSPCRLHPRCGSKTAASVHCGASRRRRKNVSFYDTLLGSRRSPPTCLTHPHRSQWTEWDHMLSAQPITSKGRGYPLTNQADFWSWGWSQFPLSHTLRRDWVNECLTQTGLLLGSREVGLGCWVGKQPILPHPLFQIPVNLYHKQRTR